MGFTFNVFLALCFLVVACLGESARYDNYRVYKTIATNQDKLKVLKNLERASDSVIFLNDIHHVNQPNNVVVAPHKVPDFLELMDSNKIKYKLLENNWQQKLDDAEKHLAKSHRSTRSLTYDWTKYYDLEHTYQWFQELASDYPEVVTVIEGGKSYQNRSILGVKISKSKTDKPGIFVEAGMHAREWIAPATATYLINQLLTSNATGIKEIAENYNWYIFPLANPDGYVYSHTTDRMWRKTRTPYGSCFGVDLNRNWGFQWNTADSGYYACDSTYPGPSAFSEIESLSLSNYITSLKGKLFLFISLHAAAQKLLYPYGYSYLLPSNYQDLKQVYYASLSALTRRHGIPYTGGRISKAIYPISGTSVDWAYENIDSKMSFVYELRHPAEDELRFQLPAEQIIPNGEEVVDSIVAMVKEVHKLGYFNENEIQ